jgi:uncharacterized protein (TIRG00374 family)
MRRWWPVIRFALGLAAAALVIWVLSSHTDELSGISSVFDRLSWGWLLPAIVVEAGSYVSLAVLQRKFLSAGGVDAPLPTLSVITLASQAIVNSVPAGAAVAAVYGFRWFRRLGANDSLAVWSLVATVVVGVLSLAVVAGAGLALAASEGASLDLVPVTVGILLVTVIVGALFLYRRPQRAVAHWLLRSSRRLTGRHLGGAEARAARFTARVAEFRLAPSDVAMVVVWGIANWIFDCGCFAFSFLAIGAGIPWKGILLSYGAGQLAANLPITPGGLGVVEGSITIALVAFGGNRVSTVAAVLVYRLISFWGQLAVGWAAAGWLALGVRSGRWQRQVGGETPVPAQAVEAAAVADLASESRGR